jgi:hypothetical protein
MRVRSPIGDMPFTVTAVRVENRELVVDGELGAWRSHISMSASDVPMLARALRTPLIAAASVGIAIVVLRRR